MLVGGLLLAVGCSVRTGPPLSHLALNRPEGPIAAVQHRPLEEKHGRGGFYIGNYNFRPAADVQAYLEEAHQKAGSEVITDADIVFGVPFALDILFFGYNHGTDKVTAGYVD
jgi:hypothetical protein